MFQEILYIEPQLVLTHSTNPSFFILSYKNTDDLTLLMLIRQTVNLAVNRNFISDESWRNVTKDIDAKIKELQ